MKATTKNTRNKRAEKKQININWNSRLFFQIGVIASLLIVFFIMQTNFELNVAEFKQPTSNGIEELPMIIYTIDVDKPKPAEPIKKVIEKRVPTPKIVTSNTIVVTPDATTDVETPITATDVPVIDPPEPVNTAEAPEDTKPKNMLNVEFVPVFPGCESLGSNAEKVECMSSKINLFINKNFRKEVLENLNANEIYKIYVNFKIDSKGYVTEVKANSHNENLKKEAQRVINTLPTMKPGKQGNKNVDVLYTVPISFKIQ